MTEYWNTEAELRFLKHLGRGKWVSSRPHQHTRLELLKNYQIAALSRHNWDVIDKGIVMNYLSQQIAELGH